MTQSATSAPAAEPKRKQTHQDSPLATIDYESENLPVLPADVSSTVLRRQGYTLSYNADFRQPNWVVYELLRSELDGTVKRKEVDFQPDPDLGANSPQLTDYRGSGYDRGHIAPAADFTWDRQAMSETFYLSNICPQGHDFNAGIWLNLENQVRTWARQDSAICIVAGPILTPAGFRKEQQRLRHSRVVIPQYFFKIILAPFADRPRAIGFIMPNQNSNSALRTYAVTVDSIESLTGIDFFPQLPDAVEREVESQCRPGDWGL